METARAMHLMLNMLAHDECYRSCVEKSSQRRYTAFEKSCTLRRLPTTLLPQPCRGRFLRPWREGHLESQALSPHPPPIRGCDHYQELSSSGERWLKSWHLGSNAELPIGSPYLCWSRAQPWLRQESPILISAAQP